MHLSWGLPVRPIRCRLLHVATTVIDRDWAYRLCNPYWRLYRNACDGAVLSAAKWQQPLAAGRIHLIPAWIDCRSSCLTPVPHFYVHFEPQGLEGAWMAGAFDRPLTLDPLPSLESEAETLAQAEDHPGNHLRLQALVDLALAQALASLSPNHRAALVQHLSGPDPVAAAVAAIEADPAAPHTVDGLARRCDLSPDHFGRIFRQRHGRTPHRWLLERRIALASERLAASNDGIDAIATASGFADRFHFTRVFTRLTGVAPGAYRRTVGRVHKSLT